MDKEKTKQTLDEIRSSYKKIHTAIFKYGIFVLLITIAMICSGKILQKEYTSIINKDPSLELQKVKLLSDFMKIQNQGKTNPDIKVYITLGEIKKSTEDLQSYNNLISYKGYIVPRLFWISNTVPLQPISYYEKNEYNLNELETFFKNIVVASSKDVSQTNKSTSILVNNILNDFNLQCLLQKKIYNGICNNFIDNFLNSFFIYNIQFDIDGFSKVFSILVEQDKYKQRACDQLNNYILYSRNTNPNITKLFEKCPEENKKKLDTISSFLEIQKELENKTISNKIYNDDNINIYKLVSAQQILFDDTTNKRINLDRINGYLDFIQELLKKNKASKIYKEVIYYFNNYQLKAALENPEISLLNDKSEINYSIKKINSINNGNTLVGFEGLSTQVNPNIILKEKQFTTNETGTNNDSKLMETLLKQISNIEIYEKIISGNNILLQGIRSLTNENSNEENAITNKIGVKLRLIEKERALYVKQLDITGHPDFSTTVNKLITNKQRSFAELQQYLTKNQTILTQKSDANNDTEEICKKIKESFSGQDLQTCNQSKIILDILRKRKIISLTISHNNFIVSNIDISNIDAKTIINNYLQQPEKADEIASNKINKSNIILFITDILEELFNYKETTANAGFEGSANTIIIVEKIKTYLGVNINDIVEKKDKILIQFRINNINFIGNYNLEEHQIQSLYFKDIVKNNLPTLIKDVTLTLDDNHKTDLDKFTIDPLGYIKEKNPESFLLYEKFTSENQ